MLVDLLLKRGEPSRQHCLAGVSLDFCSGDEGRVAGVESFGHRE